MATISSIGVGSGLPLDTLLNDLRKAENLPLQLIEQRQDAAKSRLSGYGVLKSSLDGLQNQAKKLSAPNALVTLNAQSSHEGVRVNVDSSAIEGNYQLNVLQAARAQELVTQGHSDQNAALVDSDTTLTVTLNNGNSHEITIEAGTTLSQLTQKINANSELGLSATIVNDGSENPHRLMLRARDTGTDAAVQSLQFGDTALNDQLGFDSANQTGNYSVQEATNAKIEINGIEINSQSNHIKGAVTGVDFTISPHRSYDEPIQIDITRDYDGSKKMVNDFVKSFNKLLDDISSLTKYDVETNTGSPLLGDSMTRRIKSQVTQALQFSLPEGSVRTLSQIGVEIDHTSGKLKVNDDTLSNALRDNLEGVNKLFSGDQGLGQRMMDNIEPFLKGSGSHKGFIDVATDSINSELKGLERQYLATQDRIETKMANYQRQFQQLDVMIAQMSQTSNYLAQQLGMLGSMQQQK